MEDDRSLNFPTLNRPSVMSTTAAMEHPLVSVITVNFNGERYLEGLLRSLERQTYPSFEVLVVDNGSTDGSVALVRRLFPEVRVLEAGDNLGFTGGNNQGIREAKGAYLALINNDTVVDKDWLHHLVEEARRDPGIGAVGSKILFARAFVPLTFEVPTFTPAGPGSSGDTRELGVLLAEESGFETCSYQKPIFKSGFYGPESIGEERGRWTRGQASVFLPVESLDEPGPLRLRLRSGSGGRSRQLRVGVNESEIAVLEVGEEWRDHRVAVPSDVARRHGFDVLNNAASFLKEDGEAGDRGIFESDRGQYDISEDVEAVCGCAMLLSREAVEDVGAFDEDLFMYFEDTELSWRLRKRGYRLRYQPKSVVRHFHASTSVEWSPLFHFLVSRNRILMLLKHASAATASRAYLEELYRLWRALRAHRSLLHVDVRTRLSVQRSLLSKGPRALLKRVGWLGH